MAVRKLSPLSGGFCPKISIPNALEDSLRLSSFSFGSSYVSCAYSSATASSLHSDNCNEFVLLFNRATGSTQVHYLAVDSRHRSHLMPRVSVMTMTKVQDLVGYRVVVLDNHLYVLGGRNKESGSYLTHCYRFRPDNNQWNSIAHLRRGRSRFTATNLNGYIYVTGGELRDGKITDTVECYDPVTDCWTDVRCMPKARADHSACVTQGRLFVSGGVGQHRTKHPTGYFWQYEPRSDYWSQAYGTSLLSNSRERHCMVEHRSNIYIVGGLIFIKKQRHYVDTEVESVASFECGKGNIDARITGWWDETLPPLPHPRCTATAVTLGHNIWVIGGYNYTDNKAADTVEYYNIRKKKWKTAFSLGSGNFNNIDSCVLRVPQSNRQFNHLTQVMQGKWTLW